MKKLAITLIALIAIWVAVKAKTKKDEPSLILDYSYPTNRTLLQLPDLKINNNKELLAGVIG